MMLARCLWLSFAIGSCVWSQRINSWGLAQSSFGSDSGNSDSNYFVANQNRAVNGYKNWDSNANSENSYSTWNSFGDSNRKHSSTLGSGSLGSNRKPGKETFGNDINSKWEYETGNLASWSSDKSTTNKTSKKQKSNSGNSGNWESDAFSTNNRPNEKKSASITNYPGGWGANGFSSGGSDNGNSWGSSSNSKPSSFEGNSNSGSWGSFDNNNDIFSSSDYNGNSVWNLGNKNSKTTTTTAPEPKKNYKTTSKPNQIWGSNTQNSGGWNKKKSSNDKKNSGANDSYNREQNEKTNPSRDEENDKKSSAPDLSFLDDLDKNDWYFVEESNYPKPPFKSNLNIDVSELWRKKSNGNNEKKNRRRNREARKFGGRVQCECVSVFLCDQEDAILTEEDLGDDMRRIDEFLCPRFTDVCCIKPKLELLNKTLENLFQEDIGKESLRCGQRRINGIIRDNLAQPGEFPWNLKLESLKEEINCSASLIHPKMALTAAHCVESSEAGDLEAIAGFWSTNGELFQRKRITKVVAHPDYSKENPRNDIALLVFKNPFKLTDNVNTICLPVTNDKWDPHRCFVTGSTSNEDSLRKGIVDFLPQDECQNIIFVTDFWRNYVLHNSFICGVEKNWIDLCLGDEGSAVVCPSLKSPGTYLQIALVSNSLNCERRPGILTNVLKFLDWINGNSFDLGLFDDIDVRSL